MTNDENGAGTAVAVKPGKAIAAYLEAARDQIQAVALNVDAERLIRVTLTAVVKNPLLLKCSRESIFLAVMEAAQLGLELSGPQGHAYLVPRWSKKTDGYEATLQLGYKGLASLARRSGRVRDIETQVVYEADEFSYQFGVHPDLRHVPSLGGDRGEITHFYAIALPTDPRYTPLFEVMSAEQVEEVRRLSADENSTAWKTSGPQMGRKTVSRRICNYLDLSPDAAEAIQRDDERAFPALREAEIIEVDPKASRTSQVLARVRNGGDMAAVLEAESKAGIGPEDRDAILARLEQSSIEDNLDAYLAAVEAVQANRVEAEA